MLSVTGTQKSARFKVCQMYPKLSDNVYQTSWAVDRLGRFDPKGDDHTSKMLSRLAAAKEERSPGSSSPVEQISAKDTDNALFVNKVKEARLRRDKIVALQSGETDRQEEMSRPNGKRYRSMRGQKNRRKTMRYRIEKYLSKKNEERLTLFLFSVLLFGFTD